MNALLLDVGNSRAKLARLTRGEIQVGAIVEHDLSVPERAFDWIDAEMPADQLWVASVVGPVVESALLARAAEKGWPTPVFVRTTERACGVQCGYLEPSNMGVDRWLAVIAAWHHVTAPVCVVDAGTALTVDLVGAEGQHKGGLIVPGVTLMQESLYANTRVPRLPPIGGDDEFPGRDTGDAVRQGARLAACGAVREVLARTDPSAGRPVVVIGGGDAENLARDLQIDHEVVVMPDLVLRGLAVLAGSGGGSGN